MDAAEIYRTQLQEQFHLFGSSLVACYLLRMGNSIEDFDTGEVTDVVDSTTPVDVLFEPVHDMDFIEGDSRIVTNLVGVFSSAGLLDPPAPKDRIEIISSGATYKIMGERLDTFGPIYVLPLFKIL